jgi:hypothetical protein
MGGDSAFVERAGALAEKEEGAVLGVFMLSPRGLRGIAQWIEREKACKNVRTKGMPVEVRTATFREGGKTLTTLAFCEATEQSAKMVPQDECAAIAQKALDRQKALEDQLKLAQGKIRELIEDKAVLEQRVALRVGLQETTT